MKIYNLFFVLLLILLPMRGWAQSSKGTSFLKEDSIKSELLHVTRQYSVYLPESYAQSKDKEYPVLYLLHGHSHTNRDWGKDANLQEIADRLIDTGKVCEMIIIMPDAGRIQNGYFDMKGWPYERFFFEEFLPSIEKKYRIKQDKSSRVIAGFSMGGGAAAAYAIKHPDLFSSVFAMSALMSLPKQERPQAMDSTFVEFGRSVLANDCIVLINYSDLATLEKLRAIRWFVDCGDDDFLLNVNFLFYKAMEEAKIPCELRVRDGNHNWDYWRASLSLALPFASESFGE